MGCVRAAYAKQQCNAVGMQMRAVRAAGQMTTTALALAVFPAMWSAP